MAIALEVNDLTKKYKNGRGVENISFSVMEGDIFGLLGPNGSGKTTTMKIITGLCHGDQGKVSVFGIDINQEREKALENIGCIIEMPALYDYLSAEKNLEMAARYYPNVKSGRIDDILKQTGLLAYRKDKVREFSLGMKQRLGLALALLSSPKLVLLDEPANGLDIEGMVAIREIILEQSKSKNITFLISSHLAHELELICNKVAVMKDGYLHRLATVEDAVAQSGSLENFFLDTVKAGGVHE